MRKQTHGPTTFTGLSLGFASITERGWARQSVCADLHVNQPVWVVTADMYIESGMGMPELPWP
jgi:hypothetical protein